jgi:hypothetical protein
MVNPGGQKHRVAEPGFAVQKITEAESGLGALPTGSGEYTRIGQPLNPEPFRPIRRCNLSCPVNLHLLGIHKQIRELINQKSNSVNFCCVLPMGMSSFVPIPLIIHSPPGKPPE